MNFSICKSDWFNLHINPLPVLYFKNLWLLITFLKWCLWWIEGFTCINLLRMRYTFYTCLINFSYLNFMTSAPVFTYKSFKVLFSYFQIFVIWTWFLHTVWSGIQTYHLLNNQLSNHFSLNSPFFPQLIFRDNLHLY